MNSSYVTLPEGQGRDAHGEMGSKAPAYKIRERFKRYNTHDGPRSLWTYQVVGPRGKVFGNFDTQAQAEREIGKLTATPPNP